MLPVRYENDCRACHLLQFDRNLPDRQVRHGLSPREVLKDLRKLYSADAVNQDPALLRRTIPASPIPGPAAPGLDRVNQAIERNVLTAAKLLFAARVDEAVRLREQLPIGRRGCVECHEFKSSTESLISTEDFASLELDPVVTNALELERARFDHTAHRALECAGCHASAPNSTTNPDLGLLPNIGQCVQCHAPPRTAAGRQQGGAGVACTECHRYHNGDNPAQGRGASARRSPARMSIEQFVRGVRAERDR
jgi:hypothetical protein